MKRNIPFFSLEKPKHHILEWTLTELANTLKNVLKEKFLWSFIDFFCLLHIQFSRKLNWKQWSFTKLQVDWSYNHWRNIKKGFIKISLRIYQMATTLKRRSLSSRFLKFAFGLYWQIKINSVWYVFSEKRILKFIPSDQELKTFQLHKNFTSIDSTINPCSFKFLTFLA